MKLVFLLEEESMKFLLENLLPRILPNGVEFTLIPHRGKRDLQKSIPHKLRGWNEPGDIRFVILHDQDTKDCVKLKQELLNLCAVTKRPVLVRISCQEMESWYFGDLHALAAAYSRPKLTELSKKKKFRFPNDIPSPKEELYKLIPEHQQIAGAKLVAPYMSIENNTSVSFNHFVSGVQRLVHQYPG